MGSIKYFIQFVILFIVFNNHRCYGQNIKFKHLTVDNGLSQSWVHAILQDKFGFIWIGTDDGLNRYDGYKFSVYKQNSRDKNSLNSSCILSMLEDGKGNLWIGTLSGLNLYDRKNDRFVHLPSWPNYNVRTIAKDEKQNLWIAAGNNLYYYDLKNEKIVNFSESHKEFREGIAGYRKIYIDRKQNVWFATLNKGLFFFDKEKNKIFNYYHNETDVNSIISNEVWSILEDKAGRFWIGTKAGLDLFTISKDNPKLVVFIHYQNSENNYQSISKGVVFSLLEDNKHNLWIGTENGGLNLMKLNTFEKERTVFIHFKNNLNIPSSLSNNSIQSLFQDAQGLIWVGTFGKGIDIINPDGDKFEHYINRPGTNSLNENHVNTFCEDNGFIWIGTEGGLDRYDKKDRTFKHYVYNASKSNSISSNAVWAITKDKIGNLWVGTWAGGLNLFNYKSETFTHYINNPLDKNSISNNNVFSIVETGEGELCIATVGGGLNYFTPRTSVFKSINLANQNMSGIYTETLIKSKNGDLWIENGDNHGQFVEHFSKKTGRFERFVHSTSDSSSLSGTKVYTIFDDSKNNIWIGTDVGLNLFDSVSKRFISYQARNGLPDNSIRSILEDDHGNLWIGTNKGLSKFSNAVERPSNPIFRNYSIEDGLQSNEFVVRSCLKASDGKMYFGGINGFNAFYPDSIKENKFIPQIILTDFLLFNKPVEIGKKGSPLKQSISVSNEVVLSHDQSVFTIHFAALNYVSSEKNQYAYMLEGFEKNWNYVGPKREATYTNLDPGEYIFWVKASNNDGVWNEKGTSIKITILPPWWKAIWFRMLVSTFLILLITSFFYWRVASYRKQQRELKVLVHQRTEELEDANIQLLQEKVLTEEQKATLTATNLYLSEQQTKIEEYAEEVNSQNEKLKYANEQLLEHQARIEEQAEELRAHSENLKEANDLLLEKQNLIQIQSSRLEESNQELALLNSTKDRFFSIIAHDLRNPFHAVSGLTEILLKDFTKIPPEKTERFLRLINTSSESGRNLLENLLQWSRSQTNRMKFEPVSINLKSMVSENLELVEGQIHQKSITIKSKILPDVSVFADLDMVKTIFRNLLSNAIKFTHKNGIITIYVNTGERFAEIVIADTGVGIPEKKLELLFRIDTNTSTKGTENETGTGLGLVLCKEFVEKNGGKIWVESEVGKGTEFKFTLPLI